MIGGFHSQTDVDPEVLAMFNSLHPNIQQA